ncbi:MULTISPECIES: hypothetical protein [unclassified Variovorax]|uniref:hypothetical protein n=1 Tax=unclassified Variovorax TaxID=663243 RepID=UPI003ECE392E
MDADGEFEVKRFDHEGWSVRVYLTKLGADGFVAGHADLYQGQTHQCRIALAGQQHDQAAAIVVLEEEGRAFIGEWMAGIVRGDAGAAEP